MNQAELNARIIALEARWGPFHPLVLHYRNQWCDELESQGPNLALDAQLETLVRAEVVFGPHHRETFFYRSSAIHGLQLGGMFDQALTLAQLNVSSAQVIGDVELLREARECVAVLLYELRRWQEAATVLKSLLDEVGEEIGACAPRTIGLRNRYAIALEHVDIEAAQAWYEENLRLAEGANLEADLYASLLTNLGLLHLGNNRPAESLPLFERALTITEQTDPCDPAIVSRAINLSDALLKLSRRDESVALLRRATAFADQHLPPEHPDAANVWAQLGYAYNYDATLAAQAFGESVTRAVAAWGEHHRLTLRWRSQWALALAFSGQLSEGIVQARKTVADSELALGEGSEDTLDFRLCLAYLLHEYGDEDEAVALAWRNDELTHLESYPDAERAARFRAELVDILLSTGRAGEAVPLVEQDRLDAEARGLTSPEAAAARARLARVYWGAERCGDAIVLWRQLLEECEQYHGKDAVQTLDARASVAAAVGAIGNAAEQAGLLAIQVSVCEREYGADAPRTLSTLGMQAQALVRSGDLELAARVLDRQAHGMLHVYGPGDVRTLQAQAALAVVRQRAAGEPSPDELRDLLDQAESSVGPQALTVALREALAAAELAAGQPNRAVEVLREALAEAEDVCGAQASVTLRTAYALALTADAAADVSTATEAYGRFLKDFSLGEDDVGSQARVGHARVRLRQLGARLPQARGAIIDNSSVAVARRALAAARRDFGMNSPETRAATAELGDALRYQENFVESAMQFADLYDLEVAAGGEHCKGALVAANRRAIALEAINPEAAIELFDKTLALAEQHLGPDEELTQIMRTNLADSYEAHGDLARALWHWGRNVLSYQRALGSGAHLTIEARRRTAWLARNTGRVPASLELARRALRDAQAHLTPGNETTIGCRNLLAMILETAGNVDEAMALYEANLIEGERALGDANPSLLPFRNNLARLYLDLDRPDEGLTLLRTSWDVACRELPLGDFRRAEVLRLLVESLVASGRFAEALATLNEAEPDWRRTDFPDILDRIRMAWARALRSQGQLEARIETWQEQLETAEPGDPVIEELQALLLAADRRQDVAALRSRLGLGPAVDAFEWNRELGDVASRTRTLTLDDPPGALALLSEALRAHIDDLAADDMWALTLLQQTDELANRGLEREVLALWDELSDSLAELGVWNHAMRFLASQAITRSRFVGDQEGWARAIARMVELSKKHASPAGAVLARLYHANALRRCGAVPEAFVMVEEALSEARSVGISESIKLAERFLTRLRRSAARS